MAEKSSATSETGEAIAADTPETREQMASKLVDRFALWSGVAGLVPIPVLDAVAVGGLQIQMVRRISQIYDIDFSENRGKALIASLAGSMIPATSGIGAASVLKAIPVIGTIAGGFVMPALSAGATYAIGKAFIQHFATGGRCSTSILRIIDSSSKPNGTCGIRERTALPSLQKQERQRVHSHARAGYATGVDASTAAVALSTGETEPHARSLRLHSVLCPHGTLRCRPPNGLFRHFFSGPGHHSICSVACPASDRPITSRRMASPELAEMIFCFGGGRILLGRRRHFVKV